MKKFMPPKWRFIRYDLAPPTVSSTPNGLYLHKIVNASVAT